MAQTQAGGLYRTNVPGVIMPEAAPEDDSAELIFEEFRKSYELQSRPRIVLFWNREFSDQVTTTWFSERQQRENLGLNMVGSGQGRTQSAAGVRVNDVDFDKSGTASKTTVERTGDRSADEPVRPAFAEREMWVFESAFTNPFLIAGVRLIDRASIMRLIPVQQHTAADSERVNRQSLEAAAVQSKADLLMELLLTPDPTSDVGFAFRVEVTKIATGEWVMSMMTKAEPAHDDEASYVAKRGGFAHAESEKPTLNAVARQLALETMENLASRWTQR